MIKYRVTLDNNYIEFLTEEEANAYLLDNPGTLETVEELDYVPSQKELDLLRFQKRADAKNQIIMEIAAENMERVRNAIWSVEQLISLTQDAELKSLLGDVETFSYEIAYNKVDGLTNPLLTQDIKDGWKAKLYSHFYL